ncbi:class II glutamine amidotransferase [Picrophilus oshimae]|nr:hypothetical protein [Picrophilus oshimae]
MCRMFAYIGSSNHDINLLYNALKEASRNDVIGKKIGIDDHRDGFGYVIYDDKIDYYRSPDPVYLSNLNFNIKNKSYVLFHARKGSDRHRGVIYSHPFMEETDDSLIFMIHNGLFDSDAIGEILNIKGEYSDTELGLKYIARNGIESIEHLKDYTKSTMNLIILKIDKNTMMPEIYYINYFKNGRYREYSTMFLARLNNGVAIISSTLGHYGIENLEKIDFGIIKKL